MRPMIAPNPPRTRRRPPSGPVRLAVDVLSTMVTFPATTPTAAELAPVLAAMERSGLVESWPDPDRPGGSRVMLSARSLARFGLELGPMGDRWDRLNPDRRGPRPINNRRGPRRY